MVLFILVVPFEAAGWFGAALGWCPDPASKFILAVRVRHPAKILAQALAGAMMATWIVGRSSWC